MASISPCGVLGDQIYLISWKWKSFWLSMLLLPRDLRKEGGTERQAPLLKMESSTVAPGPTSSEPCLLGLFPGPLCSALGNYVWSWGSCLNLGISLFTSCFAEFQWAQMSESLRKVRVGERLGGRLSGCLAVATCREWSKLRWETGKRVRGLLHLIKWGPGWRL